MATSQQLGRTEADYDVRLAERVREWERRHPDEAEVLRADVRRQMGFHEPPTSRISLLAIEYAFRESVRERHKSWPTKRQFLGGDDA